MIDTYSCSSCGEQFCSTCEPSVVCSKCNTEIDPECENKSTKSDYQHDIICTKCFNSASKETREQWEKGKFQKKVTAQINSQKLEKIKHKLTMTQLKESLQELK